LVLSEAVGYDLPTAEFPQGSSKGIIGNSDTSLFGKERLLWIAIALGISI
jgi:hypothetical protein